VSVKRDNPQEVLVPQKDGAQFSALLDDSEESSSPSIWRSAVEMSRNSRQSCCDRVDVESDVGDGSAVIADPGSLPTSVITSIVVAVIHWPSVGG